MNANVIRAIFKRNFVSYFSNPTGYVFICVFVFLSSLAAFWPAEFFNSNLANLNQLNKYLPYIMLVFIPAITMSIWADERRQGTDELLLTIPAGDFDVVLGKYLAAVAIFAVSLLFSLMCNWIVLGYLGNPDVGLIIGTYFGYFIVGLAMLGVGMAASFLTGNLTVGFVLGALFNAPLVFAGLLPEWAKALRQWSIEEQFRDFSRGVISIEGLTFFLSLVAVMLYASMVLIGRRHWRGGGDAPPMSMHYLTRFVALLLVAIGINAFLSRHNHLRVDVTREQLSSLSRQTRQLLRDLDTKYPVVIDAYVSGTVPENYVQTRLNVISTLREIAAAAGSKVQLHPNFEMEPFGADATRAEQQFAIRPRKINARNAGVQFQDDIFLGVAVSCGLEKVVVPFFEKGIPVEYEVVRSIATVTDPKRKKMGVLTTDAKLYGGFDMQSMSSSRNELIIDELQKQYELVQVDPTNPITERYDVLLAVQPSSLTPPQMDNFVAAVKSGQATAIFEDPMPLFMGNVPGTEAPKQPPGGQMAMMMGGRQPPQPKGDIQKLWRLLGVDFDGSNVVWQEYNPYRKLPDLYSEFVFVDPYSGAKEAFNKENSITSGLGQVLFPFPGSLRASNSTHMKFTPLATTSDRSGVVKYTDIMEPSFMGPAQINPNLRMVQRKTGDKYVLAAQITGKVKSEAIPMSDKQPEVAEEPATKVEDSATKAEDSAKKTAEEEKPKENDINVVLVSDMDCLLDVFFNIRAAGRDEDMPVEWNFDNVTFVLNVLDKLAGDDRFIEIRKRRPQHRTLETVEKQTEAAQMHAIDELKHVAEERDKKLAEEKKLIQDRVAQLNKRTDLSMREKLTEVAIAEQEGQRRTDTKTEQLKQDLELKNKQIQRDLAQKVRATQDWYKMWSVVLPPIPPLVVAFFVFFNRREREREGVAKSRLRKK